MRISAADWAAPRMRPDTQALAVAVEDARRWATSREARGTVEGNAVLVLIAELEASNPALRAEQDRRR
jgi:hypothetical protein